MYKSLIRPLLFLIDPERVHHVVAYLIRMASRIPGLYACMRYFTYDRYIAEEIRVAGLPFKGRVGLAAGFDKNAAFYRELSMFGFSFVEIGTLTPLSQSGNTRPRLFRLKPDQALVNRMGFNNMGVDQAIIQLKKRRKEGIIGGNIGKNTATPNDKAADDYAICFEKLYEWVDYFAINVSCPNITGLDKLQDISSLRVILDRLRQIRAGKQTYKPVFIKISPDLSLRQVDDVLLLIRESGFDGIIASNTSTSRDGLVTSAQKLAAIGQGGLSGKPLTKRTLEMVSYICKQTGGDIPVIGVGGIMNEDDALNLIRAGATLIQVYTGFIYEGPLLVRRINKALSTFYSNQNKGVLS